MAEETQEQTQEVPQEEQEQAQASQEAPQEPQGTDWKAQARKWEKYAKENKEKADKFDELEEAKKSELQKAKDKEEKLRKELDALKAKTAHDALVSKISKETGVPADILHGSTEEALKEQANLINAFVEKQNSGYPKDKGGASSGAKQMTREDIAKIKNPMEQLRAIQANSNVFK